MKDDESEPVIISHDFNEDESQLWKSEKPVKQPGADERENDR